MMDVIHKNVKKHPLVFPTRFSFKRKARMTLIKEISTPFKKEKFEGKNMTNYIGILL